MTGEERKDYNDSMHQPTGRKRFSFRILCGIFFLGFLLYGGSGCGRVGQSDLAEVGSLLNEGKTRLGQADYVGARAHFSRILDEYDSANTQANLGLTLAELLEMAQQILQLPSLVAFPSSTGFLPTADLPGNQYLYEAIQVVLNGYRTKCLIISARLKLIAADPNFNFQVESAPVLYGEQKIIDLGGDYDRGDILVLDAVVSSVTGGLEQLLSVNFLADYLGAWDFASRHFSDKLVNGEMDFSLITGLLVYLLNDPNFPDFLGFAPGGKERMAEAGERYAQAAGDLLEALDWVEKRKGTRSSHLVYYQDENNDRKYSEDEPLVFPKLQIPQGLSLQMKIKLTPAAVQGITAIYESFRFSSKRVSLDRHLFPIGEAILGGASEALGISPDLAMEIWRGLTGVMGDHLEFELGNIFLNPVSSRSLLPAWNSGTDRDEVYDGAGEFSLERFRLTNRFLLEWDACEYSDAATNFTCSREPGTDSDHFAEAELAADFPGVTPIPADGIISPAPYIPFPDASFNRFFWVNLQGIPDSRGDDAIDQDFHPADLYEINALLAYYSGFLLTWADNILPPE